MWEWSKNVAERAAAAVWNDWQGTESRPRVVDPEPWADGVDRDRHDDTTLAPSRMGAYILAG